MKIEKFGEKIEKLMNEKNITVKDILKHTTMTKQEIKDMLNDDEEFSMWHDQQLRKVFLTDKGFFYTRYQEYKAGLFAIKRELKLW